VGIRSAPGGQFVRLDSLLFRIGGGLVVRLRLSAPLSHAGVARAVCYLGVVWNTWAMLALDSQMEEINQK
jgi:hypothetical protein